LRLAKGFGSRSLGRDPTAASGTEPWVGALSQFGLLMWGAACGICLVGGLALRASDPDRGGFLLWTAALAALLGTDDAYLIHEAVAPESIGIPEPAMYLVLGGDRLRRGDPCSARGLHEVRVDRGLRRLVPGGVGAVAAPRL
jgi:hypothetical protein